MILTTIMLLKKLINNPSSRNQKIKIRGLAVDSKNIKKGYIFFAIKGNNFDGERFIDEAVQKGASVVICSKKCKYKNNRIIIIKTSSIRNVLSNVCSKFYKEKPKNIIAVTGTNGKTSVADLYYQILSLNNVPVASIGTLGVKYKKKIIKTKLTSPDTIYLHKILEKLKKQNIDNVIIEASSHGLHQKRINHLNLNVGIFTNFSQDHLDYHKSMTAYLSAKMTLFKKILKTKKVIICDSSIKEFSILKKISSNRNLKLIDISPIKKKLKFAPGPILNKFQFQNLSMAIAAAKVSGLKEKKIFKSLKKIKPTDGRLELIKTFRNNINVIVDFAHTPDALFQALNATKNHYGENISLVFGCGGDRDFKKRSLMAKVANSICKKIYITDDNPRNERPEKIRNEIAKHIKNDKFLNIGDRVKAIKTAISNADPNETILISGKGHETQQIYKNKILSISDKEIVKKIKLRNNLSIKKLNLIENNKILQNIVKNFSLKNFNGISIDSRTVKKDNLFLTIKGKNNDGNKFISKALDNGAKYIVSSKNNKKYKKKLIKVTSEINFLNKFAGLKRKKTNAKIIAITGSAGKTSLKNLISGLLENFGKTFSSPKSFNNHFGVPLSLSHLNVEHKYGVFELGMSNAGEIFSLSKLVKPHIGIITNIGEAHIENFENVKGIADAKSEIILNIKKGGTIILNRDDEYFAHLKKKAKSKKIHVVSFGLSKKSDLHPFRISKNGNFTKLSIKINNQIIHLKVKNINIYNVLSSLALLKELKLNIKKISKYFENFQPSEGRGRIYSIKKFNKKFKLIDESYNANPLSVKTAINNLSSIKKTNFKKYLLLGDMLELGKKSDNFHKDLSKVINNSDIDKVFIKGSKTLITYKNINKNKRGNILQVDEDIDFTLKNFIANNDYLLIKGSNATGLNRLTKRIIKGR